MTEPLVFVLPLPVNLTNGRGHWRKKYTQMHAYWTALDFGVMGKRIPKAPAQPFDRVRLEVELHHNRDMDHDGAEARLKWPLDWLVRRGYLVDDSPKHIERTGLVRQVRCKHDADRRLVLTLTPLEEAA